MTTRFLLPVLFLLTLDAAACDRPRRPPGAAPAAATQVVAAAPPSVTLTETFDAGRKGSYASAEEALPSGPWILDDALIGAGEQDRKNGRAALRIKPDGRARMAFDVRGATRVTVRVAAYGQDAPAAWQLQMSANQGRSWLSIGATQTAKSGKLREVSFVVTPTGPARFALKHAGAEGRINFDDFRLETTASGADAVVLPTAPEPAPLPTPEPVPNTDVVAVGSALNRLGVDHLALGNPSNAATADPINYLLTRPEYVLSYNRAKNTANWVSWHLSRAWKGDAKRTPTFSPDPGLPAGFTRVTTADYSGSGFDRGHLCPSDDRDFSAAENAATFRLTNIIPQAPANNQGPWRELEEYTRTLVARGNEVYVAAGPAGQGGTGTNGAATVIGKGTTKITVPQWTWKVIAVVPRGAATTVLPVPTRVIAVQLPNDQSVEHHHWDEYRVSVRQLEKLTGYNFFRTLPAAVQQTLESRIDDGPVR